MKLPFIQHIGIGLHVTDKAVRWIELSRTRNNIKLKAADVEEVENNDVEGALKALVERQNPVYPYVTVNIDAAHVKQQLTDLPEFDDPEYFHHWIDEHTEKMIPEGLIQEEFVSGYHLMDSEGEQKCLFIITKKQAVENRIELLASVGLKPAVITTGHLQAGYGLIFDDDFVSDQARLISIFEDGATLQHYDKGILKNYIELSNSGKASDILEEATTYLIIEGADQKTLENTELYLIAGNYCNEVKAVSSHSSLSIGDVHLPEPLTHISSDISADYSIAAGMAVKQLYPALDTINLLDDESQEEIKNEIQKKDALHTGILLGGLVVLIFLALMVTQFILNSRLEDTRQQVALLQDDINTVNVATERVKELKQRANQARQLVSERTSMAQTLEMLGGTLPDRVWFNEIRVNKSENGKEAAIFGFAHNDALVASLMERLEKKPSTKNVRLIFSEAVNSADEYNDASFDHIPLVQFEIRVSMNSDTG